MTNNKFKLGDRVKTPEEYEGVVNQVLQSKNKCAIYKVDFNNGGCIGYYPNELTLIDSANLSDEGINSNPIENDGINKGFNPENLTFDGREIKAGDEVKLFKTREGQRDKVIKGETTLCIQWNSERIALHLLNIDAHYPAKSELEELQERLLDSKNNLFNGEHQNHVKYEDCEASFEQLINIYDKAKKELEDYKYKAK